MKLKIELPKKEFYQTKDVVEGSAILIVEKIENFKGATIELIGRHFTRINELDIFQRDIENSIPKDKIGRTIDTTSMKKDIFEEFLNKKLEIGEYTETFSFTLPDKLQDSYQMQQKNIKAELGYYLVPCLEGLGVIDNVKKLLRSNVVKFTVKSDVLFHPPDDSMREEKTIADSIEFGSHSKDGGEVNASFSVNSRVLERGQTIPISINIENNSGKTVKGVEIKLEREIRFFWLGEDNSFQFFDSKMKHPFETPVKSGETFQDVLSFKIPEEIPLAFASELVNFSYSIVVSISLSSGEKDLKVPVVITPKQ